MANWSSLNRQELVEDRDVLPGGSLQYHELEIRRGSSKASDRLAAGQPRWEICRIGAASGTRGWGPEGISKRSGSYRYRLQSDDFSSQRAEVVSWAICMQLNCVVSWLVVKASDRFLDAPFWPAMWWPSLWFWLQLMRWSRGSGCQGEILVLWRWIRRRQGRGSSTSWERILRRQPAEYLKPETHLRWQPRSRKEWPPWKPTRIKMERHRVLNAVQLGVSGNERVACLDWKWGTWCCGLFSETPTCCKMGIYQWKWHWLLVSSYCHSQIWNIRLDSWAHQILYVCWLLNPFNCRSTINPIVVPFNEIYLSWTPHIACFCNIYYIPELLKSQSPRSAEFHTVSTWMLVVLAESQAINWRHWSSSAHESEMIHTGWWFGTFLFFHILGMS